jgi:dihydroxy-acid dehydratase
MSRCVQDCSNCSCSGTQASIAQADIENLGEQLRKSLQRNEELERTVREIQAEALKSTANALPYPQRQLRSQAWFHDSQQPMMTAIYVERYLNYGLTREELMSGMPIIGIAQTGSDLAPCNRHHLELAKRVREGIRTAGGIAFEFPTHPIQETGRRPTASLDRNLAFLGLVEILHGYPIDGVVLLTGCDKSTPGCIMAAATLVRKYLPSL